MSDLRDRIAAVMLAHSDESDSGPDCACGWDWEGYGLWKDAYAGHLADAVIRELDTEFLDFGLWLSDELRGFQMNRIDLESCIKDWKGNDGNV
jgi:hypothetical protein